MRFLRRPASLLLAAALALSLCGCGASGTDPTSVAQNFSAQSSVTCTFQYIMELDAVIGGTAYSGLRQEFNASAEVDLSLQACHLSGTMTTTADGNTSSVDMESYGSYDGNGNPVSYYRYDDSYLMDEGENSFYSILTAPSALVLNAYERSDSTEILFGRECDVYTGSETADDSTQVFVSGLEQTGLSLRGCGMDVTLHVYHESNLPADFELTYTNLPDMDIQFTDGSGNSYTVTALRYEVIYQTYGGSVETAPPQEWADYAQEDQPLPDVLPEEEQHEEPGLTEEPEWDAPAEDTSATYQIYNDDGSYYYEIATPQYMMLDEQESDYVSFYYPYGDDDFEIISYTVYNDYSGEDEAEYAQSLDELYAEMDGVSNVSSSGLQSISLLDGTLEVDFVILYMTWEDGGDSYEVIRVYSWLPTPESNGEDCLDVVITEYNGSGDGQFIDAGTELEYAYQAVLGGYQN